MAGLNWISVFGEMETTDNTITFKGGVKKFEDQELTAVGNFICNQKFAGGKISARVKFNSNNEHHMGGGIIFYYNPETKFIACAGAESFNGFSIRTFNGKWHNLSTTDSPDVFDRNGTYDFEVELSGTKVNLFVNGIHTLKTDLPADLPESQVGIWAMGRENFEISNFVVQPKKGTAFVVMQFSQPYYDVYNHVIKVACEKAGLDVVRIDETFGPGIIINDIEDKIKRSKIVIAEVSPSNPNVFYEVGYAHALGKPTILLAERLTKLPFDIAPKRTVFYDNTIAGKLKLESSLEQTITAILSGVTL